MQCSSCRTQLPEEATYCPACGALTPYGVSKYRVAPYDPTAVSFPYDASLQAPPPATGYGSPPYGVPLQNPYEPLNPYAISLHPYTFPPPANPRGRLNKALLIASIAVVLVIVVGGVVGLSIMRSTTGVAPTPTPTTVPYPSMSSAYSGSVHNITYNQSANMVLM
jgi:hypothetical protein